MPKAPQRNKRPSRGGNPLGNLPAKASRMWEEVYASAQERGLPTAAAAAQAWCAVKRRYRKKGDRWLKRKKPLAPGQQPPGCRPSSEFRNNPYEPESWAFAGQSDDATGLTIEEAGQIDCELARQLLADCAQREGCTPEKIRVRLENPTSLTKKQDKKLIKEIATTSISEAVEALANPGHVPYQWNRSEEEGWWELVSEDGSQAYFAIPEECGTFSVLFVGEDIAQGVEASLLDLVVNHHIETGQAFDWQSPQWWGGLAQQRAANPHESVQSIKRRVLR